MWVLKNLDLSNPIHVPIAMTIINTLVFFTLMFLSYACLLCGGFHVVIIFRRELSLHKGVVALCVQSRASPPATIA